MKKSRGDPACVHSPRLRSALHGVCAGFPSPADGAEDDPIDLVAYLAPNAPATFLWRVDGQSMRDVGILDGDILIVDRSLSVRHGDVVVAIVDGEATVKVHEIVDGRPRLAMRNASMRPYEVGEASAIEIWGVVRSTVRRLVGGSR